MTANLNLPATRHRSTSLAIRGEFESSPTYASLSDLREWADIRTDEVVSERVNRAGEVSADPALAERDVTMIHFDGTTGHNVAAPFWDFMNSTGLVDINGELTDGPLFPNQFFAVGRPITEPYWATVPVAGTDKDVLLQCFERRCLTYTADNPEGWQVEVGNVGAHYYEWRYGEPQGQIAFSRDGNLWIMEGNGTNPRSIAATTAFDSQPLWSPNRTNLLFVRSDADAVPPDRNYGLWGVNVVTGEERYLTSLRTSGPYPMPSFDWSSDGRQVVASNGTVIEVIDYATGVVTQRFDDLGFVFDVDWSPAEQLILFRSESPPGNQPGGLSMLDLTSDQIVRVPGTTFSDARQEWSPDGSMIVFQSRPPESTLVDLYLLGLGFADQNVDRVLIAQGIEAVQPRWSPSGDLIAYVAHDQIWIANVDDLNADHQALPKIREFDFPRYLTWSPDSTAIAANLGYLWVSTLSNEQHNLSATEAVRPDWSP